MRIGCDVDGVLARFDEAYAELITAETGIQFPTDDIENWPATWYWERDALKQHGYSKNDAHNVENKVWTYIKSSGFWGGLHAYKGVPEAIDRLNTMSVDGHDIYFITSRPGHLAKFWTELWLDRLGMSRPTVLIASDKGSVAKGLELDAFIDDKPENIADVHLASPNTMVILINRPYNRSVQHLSLGMVSIANDINKALDRAMILDVKEAAA